MNDLLLQQISNISIIKHNRDLFRVLCGLELEIRRPDGIPLNTTSNQNKIKKSEDLSPPARCSCSQSMANCSTIKGEALAQVRETLQTETYLCQSGLKKIIIPLVVNNEIIGILFTGENSSFRFMGDQFNLIKQLLIQFADYIVKTELTPFNLSLYEGNQTTRQKELLDKAVKYIRTHFHSKTLSLKEVSNNNGISYCHLSRMFKKELNTTFGQFRNQVRLEAATKLIKGSRLSISQISYTCGFDDPAYFCKVFKGVFGVSPLNFRLSGTPTSRIAKIKSKDA